MLHIPQEQEVLAQLVAWGTTHPLIHTMILTSSRTRPGGAVDPLSDYDLILVVSDVGPFAFADAWISEYGSPMVRWGDQSEMYGLTTYFRGVIYQNYVKIDYRKRARKPSDFSRGMHGSSFPEAEGTGWVSTPGATSLA
jgi:hypothetical protein